MILPVAGELPDKVRGAPKFRTAEEYVTYWLGHENPMEAYEAIIHDHDRAWDLRATVTYNILHEAINTVTTTKEYLWLHFYKSYVAKGYPPEEAKRAADYQVSEQEGRLRNDGLSWQHPREINVPELSIYYEWVCAKQGSSERKEPSERRRTKEKPQEEPAKPEEKRPDKLPYVV